jgi:hypothetical protein
VHHNSTGRIQISQLLHFIYLYDFPQSLHVKYYRPVSKDIHLLLPDSLLLNSRILVCIVSGTERF